MKPGPQFQQLFHGTSASLSPGDKVLPPSQAKAGTPNSSRMPQRWGTPHDAYENASASGSERTSWEFAGMTAQRAGGRAAVLKVGRPDDATKGLEPKEVLSKQGFPVQDVEHIMPPETVRKPGKNMRYHPNPNGRQGTLPLDWSAGQPRQLSMYSARMGDTLNHPTEDARVRQGSATPRPSRAVPKEAQVQRVKGEQMLPGMRKKRVAL